MRRGRSRVWRRAVYRAKAAHGLERPDGGVDGRVESSARNRPRPGGGEKDAERASTGVYVDNHDKGMYRCAACGEPLFDSDTKFDSGSGWPSFFKPLAADAVETEEDLSHGMRRVEVMCKACGAHL